MNTTQKLQKIADTQFGKDEHGKSEVVIAFERFVGFYAYPKNVDGCVFLGDSYQAEQKLLKRDLS